MVKVKLLNSSSFKVKNSRIIYWQDKKEKSIIIIPIVDVKHLFCLNNVIGYYQRGKKIIIEECIDDYRATQEYKKLCDTVYKWHKRRGMMNVIRSIVKWGLIPFILAIFVVSLYSTVLQNIAFQQYYFKSLSFQNNNLLKSQTPQILQPESKSSIKTKQLAMILDDGAKSGKFTINWENSSSKTKLFVFTDPLCPYCKKLDKVLNEVKSEYSIYLFPINVISGDLVANNLAEISCITDMELKKRLWEALINDTYSAVSPQHESCFDTLEANSNVFRSLNLAGTPAVFNENGIQVPNNVLNDSSSLKNWILANE